jgi:predicted RNA binding protein YcfA (HicA-like mRNA interferase family)
MSKPVLLRVILKVLEQNGFLFVSQVGSHKKYRKIGKPTLTVIVPTHGKEVPHGTFRSIIRQSGLSEEDFGK